MLFEIYQIRTFISPFLATEVSMETVIFMIYLVLALKMMYLSRNDFSDLRIRIALLTIRKLRAYVTRLPTSPNTGTRGSGL